MGNRHRGRELAFQILYQLDFNRVPIEEVFNNFLHEARGLPQVKSFARELSGGAWDRRGEIDKILGESAQHWDLKRFSAVDRAILRLGAYELLYREEIPSEVSLDECIELAKAYGGEDSSKFVNGLLDQVTKAHPRKKVLNAKPEVPKKPGPV